MTEKENQIPLHDSGDNKKHKLMQYINNELNDMEQQEIEDEMADDLFANEAVEGLRQIEKNNINAHIEELNLKLRKQIKQKKKNRRILKLPNQTWIYLSAFLILLLIIITYIIVAKIKS